MDPQLSGASFQPKGQASFNTLPAELRLKIYALTWEPRHVVVGAKERQRHEGSPPNEDQVPPKLEARSTPPVTLHINFEARELTLRQYVPFFQTDTDTLYLHPTLDIVFLSYFPRHGSPRDGRDRTRMRSLLSAARYISNTELLSISDLRGLIAAAVDGDFPNLHCMDFSEYGLLLPRSGKPRRLLWTRLCCLPNCVLERGTEKSSRWCMIPESQCTSGEVDMLFRTCDQVARGMRDVSYDELRDGEAQAMGRDGWEQLLSFMVMHYPLDSNSYGYFV
jgi:hypothetical protein